MEKLNDIVNYQLCVGCGGCSYISKDKIPMVDVEKIGLRPDLRKEGLLSEAESKQISEVCPGVNIDRERILPKAKSHEEVLWGPILAVYEGEAVDETVRYRGSSGGAVTALAAFAIENGYAEGVLHTGMDPEQPIRNKTVYSESCESVLNNTGSRYATSSPLEKLDTVLKRDGSVVVGKPCDIAGLYNIESQDPELKSKVKLRIGIFCAGVPSTYGNQKYYEDMTGADLSSLKHLKFRGDGWPGHWKAVFGKDNNEVEKTYAESWGYIQAYRQWRCYICPDHSGEFADIAIGDPWYRKVEHGETGSSMIIIRTERGKKFFEEAVQAGVVTARAITPDKITDAQRNLETLRMHMWGRLLALKLGKAKLPNIKGYDLYNTWRKMSIKDRFRSIVGTYARIRRKNLNKSLGLFDKD